MCLSGYLQVCMCSSQLACSHLCIPGQILMLKMHFPLAYVCMHMERLVICIASILVWCACINVCMWDIFGVNNTWVWCYNQVIVLREYCSFKKKFNKSSKERMSCLRECWSQGVVIGEGQILKEGDILSQRALKTRIGDDALGKALN